MDTRDQLTMSEVTRRSGFAASALRYYEAQGLIAAGRTGGGRRTYQRNVLRRLAFIRAASNVGLSLAEIRAELDAAARRAHADEGRLATHLPPLARPARRADRGARAAARRAGLLHRVRVPVPAALPGLQPRRRGRGVADGARARRSSPRSCGGPRHRIGHDVPMSELRLPPGPVDLALAPDRRDARVQRRQGRRQGGPRRARRRARRPPGAALRGGPDRLHAQRAAGAAGHGHLRQGRRAAPHRRPDRPAGRPDHQLQGADATRSGATTSCGGSRRAVPEPGLRRASSTGPTTRTC